jgi:ABC-2 type transport system permease protein
MRLYYEIALRSFRRATIYRSAYIAGLLTNSFFAVVRTMIYIALYQAGGNPGGWAMRELISYTWITQVLISIGGGWLTNDILQSIRSGDVITDLARPWSFYGYWLSRFLGERVCNLLMRGLLTYLIGYLYFLTYLPSPGQLLAFTLAVALALLVSFALTALINMTGFWLLDASGVTMLCNIVLSFFSGFMLPLSLFPPLLSAVARALPFQAITGLPAEIFLGRVRGQALAEALALQALWAVVMTGLALLVLRAAVRKVVIQGG